MSIVKNGRIGTLAMVLVILLPILFVQPAGTDYLYYYLMGAELMSAGTPFPPDLLPTVVDAPLAYPPLEYLLLAPAHLVPELGGLWVRLTLMAKMAALIWILHGLARDARRPELVYAFLLIPTVVVSQSIVGTDLNVVLAVGALALWRDRPRAVDGVGLFTLACVGLALGTKYTFLPIHLMAVAYFFRRSPRKAWLLASLLVPYALLLWKNAALYGNPVYPTLAGHFGELGPEQMAAHEAWVGGRAEARNIMAAVLGSWVPLALFVRKRDPFLVAAMAGYGALWLGMMTIPAAGNLIRFLLPLSLLTLVALSREERLPWFAGMAMAGTLALAYTGLLFPHEAKLWLLTPVFLMAWCTALKWPDHLRRAMPWGLALVLGGFTTAKALRYPAGGLDNLGTDTLERDVDTLLAYRTPGESLAVDVPFGARLLGREGVEVIGSALNPGGALLAPACHHDVVILDPGRTGLYTDALARCGFYRDGTVEGLVFLDLPYEVYRQSGAVAGWREEGATSGLVRREARKHAPSAVAPPRPAAR